MNAGPWAKCMLNSENAVNIAARIGNHLFTDNEKEIQGRGYM